MPSNACKLSQHIAHCQQLLAAHGDLDVILAYPAAKALIAIDGRNVNVAIDVQGRKLPAPAVVIGQHQDATGRITSMPGHAYQVTETSGEYNHDRDQAPEGVDLDVWRRGKVGTRDKGWREGERWFVFDGATERPVKPVEITPDAILGWKQP